MNRPIDHSQLVAIDDGIGQGEVLLDIHNVSLAFGGVKAITDISFDVRKGEIRAIIGPNGAGKTSMLNVINGFYTPQQGRIVFRGKERVGIVDRPLRVVDESRLHLGPTIEETVLVCRAQRANCELADPLFPFRQICFRL